MGGVGKARDPGEAAILAAGLPVPPGVVRYGTPLRGVRDDLIGLRWILRLFETAADTIPNPEEYGPDGLRIIKTKLEATAA
jgi:hypothetical protein